MNEDVISNNSTKHLIYGYFDNETKACYIGLTTEERLRMRHLEHLRFNKDKNKYDSVMSYFVGLNKQLPDPIVLATKLTPREAQEKEALYIEYYRSLNYFIINIAKAGSLGSYGNVIESIWTFEMCAELSKKCSTISEFTEKYRGAYIKSCKEGWIRDFVWLDRLRQGNNYWTYERCIEAAKQCTTLREFRDKYPSAYNVSNKNNWLDQFTWISKERQANGYWNKEHCFEEAMKYKKLYEFERNSTGAYAAALENDWLKDYTWLERMFKWDYDTCFEEAKKYTTRKEFHDNAKGAHRVAMKNGWMDDYTWFKKLNSGHGFWNSEENCMNEAKKYKSKSQFIKGSPGAYASALRHGWVDNYTWSEKRDRWNEKTCLEEARKYQSLKDFYENSSGAYKIASKNGWLDSYTWLKRRFEWTDETALDEARKYNSKSEFIKEKPGAYEYATRHKLPLDDIFKKD